MAAHHASPSPHLLHWCGIRAVVVPVGNMPSHVFQRYLARMRRLHTIGMQQITPFPDYNSAESVFRFQSWQTGYLRLNLEEQPTDEEIERDETWEALKPSKRVIAVIALVHCATCPSLSEAFEEYQEISKKFDGAVVRRCWAFDIGEEQLMDGDGLQHMISNGLDIFPPERQQQQEEQQQGEEEGQPQHFSAVDFHMEVATTNMCSSLMEEFEKKIQSAETSMQSLATLGKISSAGPDFSRLISGVTYPGDSNTGSVSHVLSETKRKKRQIGRLEAWIGNYCLLAGTPQDALVRFKSAIDACKTAGDLVWLAMVHQGQAAARYAIAINDVLDSSSSNEQGGTNECGTTDSVATAASRIRSVAMEALDKVDATIQNDLAQALSLLKTARTSELVEIEMETRLEYSEYFGTTAVERQEGGRGGGPVAPASAMTGSHPLPVVVNGVKFLKQHINSNKEGSNLFGTLYALQGAALVCKRLGKVRLQALFAVEAAELLSGMNKHKQALGTLIEIANDITHNTRVWTVNGDDDRSTSTDAVSSIPSATGTAGAYMQVCGAFVQTPLISNTSASTRNNAWRSVHVLVLQRLSRELEFLGLSRERLVTEIELLDLVCTSKQKAATVSSFKRMHDLATSNTYGANDNGCDIHVDNISCIHVKGIQCCILPNAMTPIICPVEPEKHLSDNIQEQGGSINGKHVRTSPSGGVKSPTFLFSPFASRADQAPTEQVPVLWSCDSMGCSVRIVLCNRLPCSVQLGSFELITSPPGALVHRLTAVVLPGATGSNSGKHVVKVSVSPRKGVAGVSSGRVRVLGCRYRIGRLVIQALIDTADEECNEREVDRCVDVLGALPLLRVVSTRTSSSAYESESTTNSRQNNGSHLSAGPAIKRILQLVHGQVGSVTLRLQNESVIHVARLKVEVKHNYSEWDSTDAGAGGAARRNPAQVNISDSTTPIHITVVNNSNNNSNNNNNGHLPHALLRGQALDIACDILGSTSLESITVTISYADNQGIYGRQLQFTLPVNVQPSLEVMNLNLVKGVTDVTMKQLLRPNKDTGSGILPFLKLVCPTLPPIREDLKANAKEVVQRLLVIQVCNRMENSDLRVLNTYVRGDTKNLWAGGGGAKNGVVIGPGALHNALVVCALRLCERANCAHCNNLLVLEWQQQQTKTRIDHSISEGSENFPNVSTKSMAVLQQGNGARGQVIVPLNGLKSKLSASVAATQAQQDKIDRVDVVAPMWSISTRLLRDEDLHGTIHVPARGGTSGAIVINAEDISDSVGAAVDNLTSIIDAESSADGGNDIPEMSESGDSMCNGCIGDGNDIRETLRSGDSNNNGYIGGGEHTYVIGEWVTVVVTLTHVCEKDELDTDGQTDIPSTLNAENNPSGDQDKYGYPTHMSSVEHSEGGTLVCVLKDVTKDIDVDPLSSPDICVEGVLEASLHGLIRIPQPSMDVDDKPEDDAGAVDVISSGSLCVELQHSFRVCALTGLEVCVQASVVGDRREIAGAVWTQRMRFV